MPVLQDASQTWMLVNGSAKPNIQTLDPASLSPFTSDPPSSGAAAVTKMFSISQTGITTWVLDQNPYSESSRPVIYGNSSDGWNVNTIIHLPYNATVDLIMIVAHHSMDQVLHPLCSQFKIPKYLANDHTDGPPYASPRPQILGPGLRLRCRPIYLRNRCS